MFCLANSNYFISETAKRNILNRLKPKPKPELNEESTFWHLSSHPSVEITYFAIRNDLRNQGIGSFLIEEIVKMLSVSKNYLQPVVTVRALQTEDGEYSAVDFYKKCGFYLAQDITPKKNIFMYRIIPGRS